MFLLDVDYFKSVNDAYGHTLGDEILIAVVARVIGLVREQDELYRRSGEGRRVLGPALKIMRPGLQHRLDP